MSDNYTFLEQTQNGLKDSKYEQCWNNFTGAYGIRTTKITQFDPYSAMSRQPERFILEKFTLSENVPTDAWIEEALFGFIRGEFSDKEIVEPKRFAPTVDEDIYLDDAYLQEFLVHSEWPNFTSLELPKDNSVEAMADSIYKILCKEEIGSTKNLRNVNKDTFVEQIASLLDNKQRLVFVLPGCPFKDQNRFRVPYDASCTDFGEISFLIRLHNLVQALYQVHPYGAQAVILSDGRLYQEIFCVPQDDVEEYQWRLKNYRNLLNLQGGVSIIDLKEMIDRADEGGVIDTILLSIKNRIRDHHIDDERFYPLIQGMKWNIDSKNVLCELSDEDAWSVIKRDRSNVKSSLLEVWDKYHTLATESAITYAATNLMLKWTDLIKKFFPDSIRCTVHPKKDQFALAMNYAWNGIAWSEKWPTNMNSIETVPYYSLANYGSVKRVRFHNNHFPCFYTTEQYNKILESAKSVLKADGWTLDDLSGREFNADDLQDFYNIGRDDAHFTWNHRIMSEEYYSTLLEFRINHYRQYGFGVHAVFKDGKLIGQMGLQVFDKEKQLLEYVIFLGKDYVGQGIGTKLLTYLLSQCRKVGITTIYGIIQEEDVASIKLATKMGGIPQSYVVHYQKTGMLYEIIL